MQQSTIKLPKLSFFKIDASFAIKKHIKQAALQVGITGWLLVSLLIIKLPGQSQVPVSREPRHHVVFENSKIRILNVLLPAGDTSQYHIHTTPSVFIGLSTTHIGSQLKDQQPVAGLFTGGNVFFENLAAPHIRIHRVWNEDKAVFHVMDIELLGKDSGFIEKPLQQKYILPETDTGWTRTYRIKLEAGQRLTVHEKNRSLVLVALSNEKINLVTANNKKTSFSQAGDFFWIDPGAQIAIINKGAAMADLSLIEVR